MSVSILATKLYIPPPRPSLVSRPRLIARLLQGVALPLTLISAPAGSGKSTLISEWRASPAGRDVPLAWLSLDERDNDPTRFLTYLVAALRPLKPELDQTAFSMLQSPQSPPLQPFLTGLINDLHELAKPSTLVLDDYHVITAQPIHEALTFLLEHLPPQLHLILLTRSDPPLPLARLRVRNQMVEIRTGDLRFTPDEAAVFFNQVMGLSLSLAEVKALQQRTEGWIAGLQLAALVLQDPHLMERAADVSTFIDAFTGSHHYVADYLSAEVLSRQPEQVRTFLLQTSILDQMTGELCDRLVGRGDGQAMLRQLDRANLFLVPLDEQHRWYRYHHLFAELLRNQLREAAPDQIPELHRRAAAWYEQHGFESEAIKHALAAGDQQHTARIIEQNAMATLMRGDSITVLNWISSIATLVAKRPWLGIYQSWALLITGEVEPIETRLQAAENWMEAHLSDADAQELGFHIAAIRALVAGRRGHAQQAIDLARQALERLPESETAIRSIVTFTLGDTSWSIGDLAGARRAFEQASRIDRTAGSPLVALLALSSVGVLLTEEGQLHRAAEAFRKVIQTATQPNGRTRPVAAVACLGLSVLEYEWNDLEKAGRYAQQALELGARWGNPDTLANAHLAQARKQHARGVRAGALESLRQAEDLARGPGVTPWSGLRIDAFRVRLWLDQDNLEAAARWARQHVLDPDDEISYPNQIAYLTLARILVAQNRLGAALALLERLLVQFETLEQMGRALELLLIQALALKAGGDKPGALAVLTRALALGEPEGYLRIFLDEGAPMAELLRHAGSRGIAPKYVAKLLSEFKGSSGAAPASQQPLIEPLTDRELQVLRLLAEGLSNRAIADRLVVALGTVKSHTASLYRKLDVTSRTQAVARATELGLL
jgi:LuxR family maltose regulon positive regulatory protein